MSHVVKNEKKFQEQIHVTSLTSPYKGTKDGGSAGRRKALNPRSSVIPRCLDCDDLSKDAVDKRVDKVLTKDVFPESTCPKTPMFIFSIRSGLRFARFSFFASSPTFLVSLLDIALIMF